MRKSLLIVLGLFFAWSSMDAQRNCGSVQYQQQEELADPKVIQRRQAIETFTQNYIQQQQAMRSQVVYTIPVVFHVVYNGSAENIPDSRLFEQLDVLNKDFRKQNTDANLVPAAWQSIAADAEINFCLATIDPSGNPTTGITRTSTSVSSFSTNDAVKYNAQGGKDAWPRDFYLNLWVCDLGGGLLGYAQFPGGAAATDGVVIDYAYTGVTGASAPYNRGRTATHEVGHWLNLIHIWGDDGSSCSGSDLVSDTPNQASENGGCPSGVVTDACTGSAPGIMWMNYMDYTDDACMYMFTNGQRTRMQACMAGARSALASSNRCAGGSGITANFTPSTTLGCAPLAVTFTNQSFGSPTSYLWNFGDGGTSTATSPTYTYNTPGTYTVTLIATGGGGSDTLVQTNLITVTGTVVGVALPFTENFSSGTFATNNWQISNPDVSQTWEITTVAGTSPGTSGAWIDFYNYSTVGQRDGMITRSLNLTGYSSAQMTFDHAYKRYYTSARSDSLIIYVSTNSCSNNWTRVFAVGENGTQTFATTTGTGGAAFAPTGSNQWCAGAGNAPCYTVSLTPFIGNNDVRVKFEAYNDYGNNLYIDNINITGVAGQAAPVANFTANSTTICAGQSINFTDQSTNSPTSWSWNFGDGTPVSTSQNPSHTYASAGTYTVTLTATNGGGSDQEIRTNYITVRPLPTATATPVAATCGNNNGAVNLSVSGGTPSYTYLWSNGATTPNISGLATGTYTVTVTDANTCPRVTSATVTAVTPPTGNITNIVHTSCGQSNGSASVTASSGTPGYTYLWSNGATTASVSALAAGSYSVTVTDASTCTFVRNVTINTSSGPSANISGTTTAGCGLSNGSATVAASGGGGSYTYLWSNGQTTATATNLAAGSYTVTVTSAGCTTTAIATVSNSGAPTASIPNFTHTSCGQNNGVASVVATGGTGTYGYLWSNSATTAVVNNLAAGTYTVTVTDQANCSSVTSVTINASSAPSATTTVQDASCGQNNGTVTANATGGNPGYTYLWSNGGTTVTISSLAPGNYLVTVTDALGCTTTSNGNVSQSSAPTVAITNTQNPACGFSDGIATANASSGTPGYTYLWSSGQSGATASNLAPGTYTVTATDALGCTATASVTLQSNAGPSVSIPQVGNASCAGEQDGFATANPTGGTPTYTFLWSNGQTTSTAIGLAAGTYTVTVTDAGGCTATSSVTITQPTALNVTATSTNETSLGAGDGTATANPSGGTPPYSYSWTNGDTTQTSTGLASGVYDVTVTDANGCEFVATVQVGVSVGIHDGQAIALDIFPNPNTGSFWVDYRLPEFSDLRLTVHNALGQMIWSADQGMQVEGRFEVRLPHVAEGIYHVELSAGEYRAVKKIIVRN